MLRLGGGIPDIVVKVSVKPRMDISFHFILLPVLLTSDKDGTGFIPIYYLSLWISLLTLRGMSPWIPLRGKVGTVLVKDLRSEFDISVYSLHHLRKLLGTIKPKLAILTESTLTVMDVTGFGI